MLRDFYPCFLANRPHETQRRLEVVHKATGRVATAVARPQGADVQAAIDAAARAAPAMRALPAFRRAAVLEHVVSRLTERAAELAHVLAVEVGKPLRDARGEVARAIDTFRISAQEALRIDGQYLPLDISPRAAGCEGIVRRVPVGPCALITPFNFPLNLAAHKVGPAIAAGCPWVLKPASAAPVSALLLGEILAETDLPPGAFSVLPCSAADAAALVADERIAKLSFTGSAEVGWRLRAQAGAKRVTLELGGNAPCLVDRDADLERAAERITFGAFYQAGQSCISVQRVLVHRDVFDELAGRLVRRAEALRVGDPLDEQTDVGPLISEDDARRVEQWVAQAVRAGARLLCGGRREGPFYWPTWLTDVDPAQPVVCREVFGPVAVLAAFDDWAQAVRMANDTRYGLQAGVFTRSLDRAWYAFRELEYGGVIVNDVPSMRVDSMPYGGVKHSGLGREGVRCAIREMTEPRLLVLRDVGRPD